LKEKERGEKRFPQKSGFWVGRRKEKFPSTILGWMEPSQKVYFNGERRK